jgi:hypothetical protein
MTPVALSPPPSPTSSTPPPASPPPTNLNITSLGCYADDFTRLAGTLLATQTGMSIAVCAELAWADDQYTMFGIQYGMECYAGEYSHMQLLLL